MDRVQEISSVRERHDGALRRADVWSAFTLGWGYVAIAVASAFAGAAGAAIHAIDVWTLLGLVALYALAHNTVFAAATGSAVPNQPILVAMLLLLPLHLVPITLLAGVLLGAALEHRPGRLTYRLAVDSMSAWHCLGPVAVLALADPGPPSVANWPVYLIALGAQFVVDALVAAVRTRALGMGIASLAQPMLWTFTLDVMLAPIGLTAVIAAGSRPQLLLFLAAPIGMIRLLAADRSVHLEQALTLGEAYAEVSTQARVDSMTGIANRRGWEEALADAQAGLGDGRIGTCHVVMADLDHLKRTNDMYGHQAGDELIRNAAAMLRRHAPPGSLVARLGGDEFGVLIIDPQRGSAGLRMVIDVRDSLMEHPADPPLSISLGVAEYPPCRDLAHAVEVADAAASLDKLARRAGRDAAGPSTPATVLTGSRADD